MSTEWFKWRIGGFDRQRGALGVMQPFAVEVVARTAEEALEQARARRYAAGREHVHIYTQREIGLDEGFGEQVALANEVIAEIASEGRDEEDER